MHEVNGLAGEREKITKELSDFDNQIEGLLGTKIAARARLMMSWKYFSFLF